jgi:uncharacterized membrane protein
MSTVPAEDQATATAAPPARDHRPAPARGEPQPEAQDRAKARGRRLPWLDALRGIAALCVVYSHFGTRVLPAVHRAVYNVFDPGLYGVLVFFLVSGYIVPAWS